MDDHRALAEQMLGFTISSPESALAHAVLALVDKLDDLQIVGISLSDLSDEDYE